MKLGLVLPPIGDRAAGLAVYVREISTRLLAAHDDWVVFGEEAGAAHDWCRGAEWVPMAAAGRYRLAARLTHRRLARLLTLQTTLRREIRRRRVAALLVPFHDGVYRCPAPQAIVVHDLTLLRRRPPGSGLDRAYMRLVVRPTARATAALVAVSRSTRDDLGRFWGVPAERVRVIYEGFDRSLFHPFSRSEVKEVTARHGVEGPYLFYAGTLAPHKNLTTVLGALARAAARRPELALAAAGPWSAAERSDLLARARRLGVAERVRTLGYVDRADLGPLMAGAVAFVFPSLEEGFGLAALEAMASGAAVLASDRASLPEVVGEGGLLLDPTRPDAWSRATLDLLERPEWSSELRRRARAQAARFDWDLAAAELLRLLLALGRRA